MIHGLCPENVKVSWALVFDPSCPKREWVFPGNVLKYLRERDLLRLNNSGSHEMTDRVPLQDDLRPQFPRKSTSGVSLFGFQ